MSNGNSSTEVKEPLEVKDATPIELLEALALNLQKLGPVIDEIILAERDLRLVAARDTKFAPALDRAEHLASARQSLERLRDSLVEYLPMTPRTESLGAAAITHAVETK